MREQISPRALQAPDMSDRRFRRKLEHYGFRRAIRGADLWFDDLRNPGHSYGAFFINGRLHRRLTLASLLQERYRVEVANELVGQLAKRQAIPVRWGSTSSPFQEAAHV